MCLSMPVSRTRKPALSRTWDGVRRRWIHGAAALGVAALLSACGAPKGPAHINHKTKFSSAEYGVKGSPRITTSRNVRKGGGRYQVGKPYKVRGKWYHPKEQPLYNRVGMASWYGPNFHGRLTANGEVYDQYALSAAHPTLPLPSYARVTNLENGRSLIVRVNDRGPFVHDRIIDLSRRAAEMLDYTNKGVAKVRVRYVGKARMDGRDGRYLMASYRGGLWRGRDDEPDAAPSATMLAGGVDIPRETATQGALPAPVPPPSAVVAGPVMPGPDMPASQLTLTAFDAPVPLPRPTPLYEGIPLDLGTVRADSNAGGIVAEVGRAVGKPRPAASLSPLGYLPETAINARILSAFDAVDDE